MHKKKEKRYKLTDHDRLVEFVGVGAALALLVGCFLKVMFL